VDPQIPTSTTSYNVNTSFHKPDGQDNISASFAEPTHIPPKQPKKKNMSLTNPSKADLHALLTTLESHFPSSTLGSEKWFILALASLVAGGHPDLSADLYLHLIARPEYQTPKDRQALVRRLREVLVKLVAIVGVPKCIDAVFSIAGVEREEDRDYSFSR